ncbi:MFS transporter [Lactobacillus sp. ESL0731]|uniref:MFS transporter n=1 Tax=unclassified Lactobacillus TaxID=2620435 RepID=UPI0023F9BB26|nr:MULTISPECIES: MFS transporter [unclassified Lactobacillus]WEV51083.1 MFS transporter [Lactobacillus sp. ESL0700]WEV62212.1 MFS transporter [Lactobacillus sp. ESL0731]
MNLLDRISKRVYTKRKITTKTAIAYGVSDFVGGGGQTIIGAWLLYFYTSFCNLSATQGALIVAIGKIVSATFGFIIGGVSDNFYRTKLGKRFGRRHFFLFFGAPFLAVFALMWVGGLNFWYYLITFCLFDVVTTITIPYETLPTEMTTDFNERTKLSTVRMFCSASATFLATWIPGQLFKILGQKSPMPFFINGLVFTIIFISFIYITAFNTWEKPVDEITLNAVSDEEDHSIKVLWQAIKSYFSTFRNKSFRKHLVIYLFSFTGKDVYNTIFTYFCVYVLGVTATVAANMLSLSIVGLITSLIGGLLIIKIGPRWMYVGAYLLMLAMLGGYYSISQTKPSNIVMWLFIISFIYQIGRSMLEFTPWNVYPFIPDTDEIVTGENRAGVFASVITLLRNLTASLATVFVGMFLDAHGFVKNAASQSAATQHSILNALVFGAGTLILIALITSLTFKLNKQNHKIIVDEISRLRNGGSKADATDEVKKVVKELTGTSYDDIKLGEDNDK